MFIKTFPVGVFQCNCSIIADEESGEAFVVDPGDEAEKIVAEVQKQKFVVKYIIHTHAHIDHIGATGSVHKDCGGEICLHRSDLPLYDAIDMQAQLLGIKNTGGVLPVKTFMEHGDVFELGKEVSAKVLFTPGHTPGSVCFMLEKSNLLLSGDTLFFRSIGRTDLWGGDYDQIIASIKEKLFKLPDQTLVIPGHGPTTQIGSEKKENPFVRI